MNIPQITSIDNALSVYYGFSEIGNKEIQKLFGKISPATVAKLKKVVIAEMNSRDKHTYGMYKVVTSIAFDVWGLDVLDLESRRNKLKDLKLQ